MHSKGVDPCSDLCYLNTKVMGLSDKTLNVHSAYLNNFLYMNLSIKTQEVRCILSNIPT